MIGLLAMLAFQAVFAVGNYFRSATLDTPFGWQDEGYVLGPAIRVYEGGWEDYRCRGNQIICYGAVHTFFDVLLLHALPDRWLKDSPLAVQPGPEWFYQSKYPNAFVALRTFRVVIAVFLLALLGWIAWRGFRSIPWSIAWALALPSFPTFQLSRMGLKNDFSFALYLVVFLLLANEALKSSSSGRTRWFFHAAVVAGVAGISVKFGIVLPLALLAPAYLVISWKSARSIRSILIDFAVAGVLALVAFLATNPSFGVSLGEANWISSFISATGRTPTGAERRSEFLDVLLPNLWPLAFCLFAIVHSMKKKSNREIFRWAYLVVVPVLWAILTWKSAYHRPAYYLPILVWVFVIGTWLPRLPGVLISFLGALLVFQAGKAAVHERAMWNNFSNRATPGESQEPWKLFNCGEIDCAPDRWVIDRTVRAAVPEKLPDANLLYFDSLVESPAALARKIAEKWPDLQTRSPRILVTCWSFPPAPPDDPLEFYSPAGESWGEALREFCSRKHPLNANAAFAFENGWRPTEYRVLEYAQLRLAAFKSRNTAEVLAVRRDGLSPRMLEGAWQGIDSWYAPIILDRNAVLEGEFAFPDGLSEATLPFESTCKGEGRVTLEIAGSKADRSADTRSVVCARRPWVCRAHLENWWTERVAVEPIALRIGISRNGRARVRIRVTGGDPDRCRISLGNLRFKPEPSL